MKNSGKLFFPAILFLLTAPLFSQSVTIQELRDFNQLSMDAFKKEAKENRKFSYYDKTETPDFSLFEYDKFENDQREKIGKFIYLKDTSSNRIEYSTTNKAYFEKLKKSIIEFGYKPNGSGKIPGGELFTDYKINQYQIRLVVPAKPATADSRDEYTVVIF
jgi:hypothetical protein